MLNWDKFEALTFDCYGTLIDWEGGILAGLKPLISAHQLDLSDDELLELFGELEVYAELTLSPQCNPPLTYKEVLTVVANGFCQRMGIKPSPEELVSLRNSVKDWPAFPDSVDALKALKKRWKLGILSNIDDNLFAFSAQKLQMEFDWVITAEQIGSYKPTHRNFEVMLERLTERENPACRSKSASRYPPRQ
jgi:2-haloacid dehalogenase